MDNATIGYNGARGSRNCTVSHPDITRAVADQKAHSGKAIAEHAKGLKRHNAKGTRNLTHMITEEIHKDGLTERQKVTVNTKRRNH